jgi:hypothetical protein
MFPGCPPDQFFPHRWREDTVELGRLEAEWVEAAFTGSSARSGGPDGAVGQAGNASRAFYSDWPVQVNRILRDGLPPDSGSAAGPFSLIVSIGQVVPHEVVGMANHAKNVFVGTGGAEAINKSHYFGALYGLERIMGKAETPVRALFDEAFHRYGSLLPPVLWVLTVVDPAGAVRGLFSGFGRSCFEKASALSEKLNIKCLEEPARKIVVWLSPREYRSMWLGNKSVYRTRMAIATGGELVILAPGLDCFGEDSENDALIRRYGYRGAEKIRQAVEAEDPSAGGSAVDSGATCGPFDLPSGGHPPDSSPGGIRCSLSAAAHLIHGSSEGRFTIRYCTDPEQGLGREEVERVGYLWGNLDEAIVRYVPELQSGRREQGTNDPSLLNDNDPSLSGDLFPLGDPPVPETGWRISADGERFYFVANPALGLWQAG